MICNQFPILSDEFSWLNCLHPSIKRSFGDIDEELSGRICLRSTYDDTKCCIANSSTIIDSNIYFEDIAWFEDGAIWDAMYDAVIERSTKISWKSPIILKCGDKTMFFDIINHDLFDVFECRAWCAMLIREV
jgi:hypothetical protein